MRGLEAGEAWGTRTVSWQEDRVPKGKGDLSG